MAIWDYLSLSKPKNGERKDGKVYMNGTWITEAEPLLKPKVYNNNVGVPIDKDIVDKYKDEVLANNIPTAPKVVPTKQAEAVATMALGNDKPSSFWEKLKAKDSKGNSTLSSIGDTLIAIGSKGWANNGLGAGAEVFGKSMDTLNSTETQSAAKDEALKVFNDPNATPQQKMAARLKAGDAGVDTTVFDTMLSTIGGMKLPTGKLIDPNTGKEFERLAPTETSAYKQEMQDIATNASIKIGDEQVRQNLAQGKGMSEIKMKEWEQTNPEEFRQEMEKARLNMEGQEAAGNRAMDKQEQSNIAAENRAASGTIRAEITDLQTANDKWDQSSTQVDNFKNALTAWNEQDASTFEKVVAEAAKNPDLKGQTVAALLASNPDVMNKLIAIEGAATQLGISQLRGLGSMAATELAASTSTFFNPRAGSAGNKTLFDNYYTSNQGAYNTRKEQIKTKTAQLESYSNKPSTASTTTNQTTTSDSGGTINTSIGKGWKRTQ